MGEGGRNDAETIARLYVPSTRRSLATEDGSRVNASSLVRLDNVVKLVPTQTASRIDRLDRQRQVALHALCEERTPLAQISFTQPADAEEPELHRPACAAAASMTKMCHIS